MTADALAHPVSVDDHDARQAHPAHARTRTLASALVWRHKLILTGRLDRRTAVELEDEIECLCEEGVTILILDLRQLSAIDSVGAGVIAYRGAVCEWRGCGFAVIPGSPVVHYALVQAGVKSLLVGDPGETGVISHAAADSSPRDTSTAMIRSL
jgi:anti-anti-sigma factor